MPTRNRRRFVGQSIWYFLRQDYAQKELIFLDDGEDSTADLNPTDERICYVRLDRPLTLGAKRNLGCEMSRGELIAHWDYDDWVASHRLSMQVGELLRSDSDMCGARELLHYKTDAAAAWLYRYPSDEEPWLAGGTLLYRRRTWTRSPFSEINLGEDRFIWQQPRQLNRCPIRRPTSRIFTEEPRGAKRPTDPYRQRRPLYVLPSLTHPIGRLALIAANRSQLGTAERHLALWRSPEALN